MMADSAETIMTEPGQWHKWPHYSYIAIILSALTFAVCGKLAAQITPNRVKSAWKFKNIFISLVHAAATGIWAFYCLLFTPGLANDVINIYDASSYTLVCFSLGYVIYDCMDMLVYHRKKDSFELLGHHAVIIVAFGIAVFHRIYVGYAVVALVAEINSVFLHIRQLMLICRVDKSSSIYRLNSLVNVGSYITFRIMTFAWMTRWLFLNKDLIPLPFFTVGSIGLAVITAMNIVLFYRLLKTDFFRSMPTEMNKTE